MGLFGPSKREKQEAHFMAPQWLKIANDCAHLVNTTVNPEVFFYRYDLLLETVGNLAGIEKIVKFKGKRPSLQLLELQAQRERETDTFIDRAFEAVSERAAGLKTEKGQAAAVQRFLQRMEKYADRMTPGNLAHLESLK